MAETILRGPGVIVGSLMDGRVESFDGPGVSYQGDSFPDVRFSPLAKDGLSPGRVQSFFNNPYVVLVDSIPMATNATALVNGAAATASTAFPLATAALGGSAAGVPSIAPATPLIPFGGTTATTAIALDFGFTTGTTVANSSTIAVVDNSLFKSGQWLVIGGVGNATLSKALITQVQSIATTNTTAITVSPSPATALSHAPIGQGNLFSPFLPPATPFGPTAPSASAATPYTAAGLALLLNPIEGVTRNLTVSASSATGGTATVVCTGYDIYGNLMTELLTANGTTVVAGKKAFKYVLSAVAQQTQVATYSIGVGNIAGIHLRSDKWEYLNVFYNGGFMGNNTGWVAAATTSPATNTTGDVRGTINGSTIATTGAQFDGTKRLAIMMSVPIYNMINATPINTVPLFGVAQSTT